MRKHINLSIFSIFLLLMVPLFFVSCGGNGGPTTPQIPSTFKITDIKALSADEVANLVVVATYAINAKDEPFATGTLWLGDGSSEKIDGIQLFKDRTQWQSSNIFHLYNIAGPLGTKATFHLKAEITVPFSTGTVKSTFEKDIEFTKTSWW